VQITPGVFSAWGWGAELSVELSAELSLELEGSGHGLESWPHAGLPARSVRRNSTLVAARSIRLTVTRIITTAAGGAWCPPPSGALCGEATQPQAINSDLGRPKHQPL